MARLAWLILLVWIPASAARQDTPTPVAPMAHAGGSSVNLAWTLPPGPRLGQLVILRALKDGDRFEELATLDASALGYLDDRVEAGRTYQYALRAARGGPMSPVTEVSVGGGARITLRGGSTERAVFEVTTFAHGRRLSASFVVAPGEPIGDLTYVPEVRRVVDFRLGCALVSLALETAESTEAVREALVDDEGRPLTDLAGRPIALDFAFRGARRETLAARVTMPGSVVATLHEGASRAVR